MTKSVSSQPAVQTVINGQPNDDLESLFEALHEAAVAASAEGRDEDAMALFIASDEVADLLDD